MAERTKKQWWKKEEGEGVSQRSLGSAAAGEGSRGRRANQEGPGWRRAVDSG